MKIEYVGARNVISKIKIKSIYGIGVPEEDLDFLNNYDFEKENRILSDICKNKKYVNAFSVRDIVGWIAVAVFLIVILAVAFMQNDTRIKAIVAVMILFGFIGLPIISYRHIQNQKRKLDICTNSINYIGYVQEKWTEKNIDYRDNGPNRITYLHYTVVRFKSDNNWYEVKFQTPQQPWEVFGLFQFCFDIERGLIYDSYNYSTINYITFEQTIDCL